MQKNIKSKGKTLIDKYIKNMDVLYNEQKELQDLYSNDKLTDEYYNINKSLKFTRTWEIINNDLDYAVRNLLLLFNACDCRYKETLEALSGSNCVQYKNVATLHVMVTRARKIIKNIYNEKYGDN